MSANKQHWWQLFYTTSAGFTVTWLIIYALVLGLASTLFFYKIPLPEEKLTFSHVEYIASSAVSPLDLPDSNWYKSTLPDNWQDRNIPNNIIWYRGTINLESVPHPLYAVLIPALKMNAAVYINGSFLGDGGRFSDPVARNWMTPLLFSIPDKLFVPGKNTIHIRVKSDPPGSGKLSKLYFGTYQNLENAFNVHYQFRITSIKIITAILISMGGFIAILWLIRRKESYYGYYALATIVWGLHNFNIFITEIPVNTRLWDWLSYITITYYSLLAMFFIHRFLDKHSPKLESTVTLSGIIGSLSLLLLDDETFYEVVFWLWYPATFLLGLYVLIYTCIAAWKRKSIELQLLTATGGTTILFAIHDLMVMHGCQDWQDGYYIQYSAAVLLTLFSVILIRRFANSLNEVDALNYNLEKRVQEKCAQLENNFNKLRQMENEQARSEERERLMREIHDGMGSHLVSILAMIESGHTRTTTISMAVKNALNELRLMVDSMDMGENDLNTILGMFRMRIEPVLNNSQLKMVWKIEDIPPIPDFGPREALNIIRILQEFVTNTIKHAQAKKIQLTTYTETINECEMVVVDLSDDGKGFSVDKHQGHGIKNIRYRAKDTGAQLTIDSNASGTRIRILFPITK